MKDIKSINEINFLDASLTKDSLSHSNKLVLKILLAGIFISLISAYFWPSSLLIFLLLLVIIPLYCLNLKKAEDFYIRLATINGFDYMGNEQRRDIAGFIFKIGYDKKMENTINFKMSGHNLYFFDYCYRTGHGKTACYYSKTIIEIVFNSTLPQMILLPKSSFLLKDMYGESGDKIKNPVNVSLDGKLFKNYDLIVEKNLQIEALQIFTPDFISNFYDNYNGYSIEFNENKAYIIYDRINPSNPNFSNDFKKIFQLAGYLIKKINPIIEPISKSVKEIQKLNKLID